MEAWHELELATMMNLHVRKLWPNCEIMCTARNKFSIDDSTSSAGFDASFPYLLTPARRARV